MNHRELYIGGHFLGGPCDQSYSKGVSRSPWSGSVVGTVAEGTYRDLVAAIDAAHEAFPAWSKSDRTTRQKLLLRVRDFVRERSEELAQLLVAEIGKPITFARAEVERTAITFELAAWSVPDLGDEPLDLGPDPRASMYSATVRQVPRGVIFAITPYNWPLNLAAHKIAPALAAGCAVVLKVSPLSSLCGLEWGRILHDAGAPPGLFNVWHGETRDVQRALEDDRIGVLSFTGSAAVGWGLRERFPRREMILECGGDANLVVFEDADLEAAADRAVMSAFGYAGQVCISAQHVRVSDSIYERFRDTLLRRTEECRWGDPGDVATVCGPMIHSDAAARIESEIDDAISKGAIALVRGERKEALLTPTLLERVPADALLSSKEAFGPVLLLHGFSTMEDLTSQFRSSPYALQAGVFTQDESKFVQLRDEVSMGGWVLNDAPSVRFDAMPYGGLGESGLGVEGVSFAIERYLRPEATVKKTEPPRV